MTDTEAALLRAIAAMPAEDTPRLVYADYLDETGEPAAGARAELIRLQVRSARLRYTDPERVPLEERAEEVLLEWFPTWAPELPTGFDPMSGCYDRGFVYKARAHASATFGSDAEPRALLLQHLELNIDVSAPRLREAMKLPLFTRLTQLVVRGGTPLGWSGAKAFAEGEYPNLEVLGLAGQAIGDIGLRYLCNSWGLLRLRELDLANNGITDDGAAALLRSGLLPRLQRLSLWGNEIGHTAMERLRADGRVW